MKFPAAHSRSNEPHPPIYYGATSPDSPAKVARRGWNLAVSAATPRQLRSVHQVLPAERVALGDSPNGGGRDLGTGYLRSRYRRAGVVRSRAREITRFWQLASDNVWRPEPVTTEDLTRFTKRFAYFQGGLTLEPDARMADLTHR